MSKRKVFYLILVMGIYLCSSSDHVFSQQITDGKQDDKHEIHFSSEKISRDGFTLSYLNDKTITARVNVRDNRGMSIQALFTCPYEISR